MILLRVLSAFCPRVGGGGGEKSHCMDLGGKHIFVCKACGKLGASGGMLPWGNFDFGPFIIWWNLGLFLHKQFTIYVSLKPDAVCFAGKFQRMVYAPSDTQSGYIHNLRFSLAIT